MAPEYKSNNHSCAYRLRKRVCMTSASADEDRSSRRAQGYAHTLGTARTELVTLACAKGVTRAARTLNFPPLPTTEPSGNDAYMAFSDANPVKGLNTPFSMRPAYRLVAGMVGSGGLNIQNVAQMVERRTTRALRTVGRRFESCRSGNYNHKATARHSVHYLTRWTSGRKTPALAAPCDMYSTCILPVYTIHNSFVSQSGIEG